MKFSDYIEGFATPILVTLFCVGCIVLVTLNYVWIYYIMLFALGIFLLTAIVGAGMEGAARARDRRQIKEWEESLTKERKSGIIRK